MFSWENALEWGRALILFYFFRTKKQIDESHKHLKDIEETLKVSALHPFKFKKIPFNFDTGGLCRDVESLMRTKHEGWFIVGKKVVKKYHVVCINP